MQGVGGGRERAVLGRGEEVGQLLQRHGVSARRQCLREVKSSSGTMAVNATGVFYGMRAAIPALRRAGGGSIINIASIYGPVGAPRYVAYTASKGAVIAMTKVAALEHANDRIRVNAICPGPVRSPMSEQEGDASVNVTPLRRRAEPEEISSAVAFLASDDAGFVTGAELAVDGGYLAR